jgi:hypothetical protein
VDGKREAVLLFRLKWFLSLRGMSTASPGAMVLSSLNCEADVGSKYAVDLMREHWNVC